MIIFLYGEDTFRSRKQLKKMIDEFKAKRDPQGFNVFIFNCQTDDPSQILEHLSSVPFLAEKKLIVLEKLLSATKKEDLQNIILEKIKNKSLPESNNVLFWEDEGKAKTKVSKELLEILAKEKFAQQFEKLAGPKLSAWIKQEIKERGGEINPDALTFLTNNSAADTWKINSVLDQLIAFDPHISLNNVELFFDEKIDDNIFNLVDGIINGNTKQSFQMIREQYRIGEDAQFIFAMLLRQFRILTEMRDLLDRQENMSSDQMAKMLDLHPFVVKKSLPMVKKYSLKQLKNIYDQLLEVDAKTKTGQGDQSLLLDLFVGRITCQT